MGAAIMTAAEHAFAFRHQLLRRAVGEMIPALAVAAAHSAGLARSGPARLAQAAAQHPDPWARASAAKALPSSWPSWSRTRPSGTSGLNNRPGRQPHVHSTHTAAYHLCQAFRKLSIAARYELTRIVIERAADGSLVLVASGDRA